MDKITLGKYCINCKCSVWINERLLCIKHGKTIENDDYCHDFDERDNYLIVQEVNNDEEDKR